MDETAPGIERLETPERVDLAVELAGVGSRSLAFLVDWSLVVTLTLASLALFFVIGSVSGTAAMVILLLSIFVLWWLYFALFEGLWHGQTPGKRLLGLRVQKLGGYPAGWPEILIRNLLRVVVDLFLLTMPIGLVVMLVNRRSQRIGDLAAGTVVVRESGDGLRQLAEIGYLAEEASHRELASAPELTAEEFELLREFLERRSSLEPAARQRIEARLADLLRERLAARQGLREGWDRLGDEAFLVRLDSAYRGEVVSPLGGGAG